MPFIEIEKFRKQKIYKKKFKDCRKGFCVLIRYIEYSGAIVHAFGVSVYSNKICR